MGDKGSIIVLGGASGGGNCGDELMCEAALHYFAKNAPHLELITDSQDPAWVSPVPVSRTITRLCTDRNCSSLAKAIKKPVRYLLLPHAYSSRLLRPAVGHGLEFLEALRSARAIFCAGHGMLAGKYLGAVCSFAAIARAARKAKVPMFISGVGVGPFSSSISRYLASKPLKAAELVTLREGSLSLEETRRMGVDQSRVLVVPDDAAFYSPLPVAEARYLLQAQLGLAQDEPYIAVSIMKHILGPDWSDGARALGRRLAATLPAVRKVFVPMAHEDMPVLQAASQADAGSLVVGPQTPAMTKATMGGADMAISARYHGCVFALSQRVPTLAIHREDYWMHKNAGVIEMFQGGCQVALDGAGEDELPQAAERLWLERSQIASRIGQRLEVLKEHAYYCHRRCLEHILEQEACE